MMYLFIALNVTERIRLAFRPNCTTRLLTSVQATSSIIMSLTIHIQTNYKSLYTPKYVIFRSTHTDLFQHTDMREQCNTFKIRNNLPRILQNLISNIQR